MNIIIHSSKASKSGAKKSKKDSEQQLLINLLNYVMDKTIKTRLLIGT